ncbi:uncharacterized protein TNCV_1013621 [Trichonephila clavipes]|uniref:DNA-directed DNA polymerase n=1 Tax=Trichonephila clavipes TaxID=2585209 RepID=A0A8X6VXI8_TRICX|nr:uncharacterized protein TNCV_1013621 [Trichonephila clavipes]
MLLHTKVAIELFTDYDMLLFIEKGVRGGISQCCNRYAIANNRYMSNFNPDDEIKYLMYLDANNLYGYAMSKYLPLKDFVWSDNDLTEQDILNLSDESDVGYILEVDLEYPSDLHDKHSDFPLAPENKPPPNCKEPRLLTTLEPKTKYVLHYSNLKLYLKLGDMKEDINLYDTSDYDENNIYNLPLVNKKVIGKMKDENKGNIMTEYVGLKSKMYAYKTNNKIEKRLKGIKKQTIKNKITFEDYKACLFNEKIKYVDMNLIRSKFHSLHSIKQNKLALSYKDDKRFINGDGITTLAHGENNSTQQQERTTQLVSRNETTQLNRRKQLNSSVGTKQLNSALPSTAACNRLQPPTTACNRLQPPTTAYNRLQPPTTACNRLQPPTTACNRLHRLHRLYSRIGFFYLLIFFHISDKSRKFTDCGIASVILF